MHTSKKKVLLVLLFFLSGFFVFQENVFANEEISIVINGEKQQYDQPPIVKDQRTLVPLRGVFESLGATVEWNQEQKKVTAHKGSTTIELTLNSKEAKINGVQYLLDVPAIALNGRTLVPIRFIGESLGAKVGWIQDTKTVTINTSNTDTNIKIVPPPEGVVALASNDQVKVNWIIDQNVDYYHVYFNYSMEGAYLPFLENSNSKAKFEVGAIHTGVNPGETWYYKVTAVKNGVESDFSNVVSATLPITPTQPNYQTTLILIADNHKGTYLGKLTTNKYDSESIFNEYGAYGSPYRSNSIWNEYGTYGSPYATYSAFNEYSQNPPIIYDLNGNIYGRVTTNPYIQDGINPNILYQLLKEAGY
ncbi:copper amine oxidase N-terminal domain-containing protein [Bacillaceae bacterium S4-13-56]